MKQILLTIGAILLGIALRAQSVIYTCRYWFDQDHAQAVTASFSDSTWQADIDVGLLSEGLHNLRLQMADTANHWNPPQTYLFFKLADTLQEDFVCHYWFDQNHEQILHNPLGNGHLLLDVADLEDGIHTINVLLEGEKLTTTQNYTFVKVAVVGTDTLNMSNLVYHCWFDQDFEHRQTDSIGNGHCLLDVAELSDGIHTVNVLLEGDALTTTTSYTFMKVAVGNPSTEYQYHCWFDDNLNTMQTGWLGSGCFQLDVDGLPKGFHTVSVQLDDNGMLSAPQVYMFYRQPLGGCGISRWEYWLNDNGIMHSTDIEPTLDTLDIISLLPVETWPIRSSCFHFHPNGDEPYLNAKNKISFRFWNTDDRFIEQSTFYVDENVSALIEADTLERNTTVSIAAPRNNSIKWFKLPLQFGDSVAFMTDKACTIQLFAPSGEEVYLATAGETMVYGGCHAWEDGTYYLAVHDVTGSGEEISLTNIYVHRYAILAYDVHLVGNGGCSTITFQGNGFNSLLNAYLVNWQNDTIRSLDIGHESNTTTTVSLNFYQANLGVYDAVFEFFEETIRINGALEVQEPVDIYLTSTVSYPTSFMSGTTVTYDFTITNNGNMSAYVVPLYLYVASPSPESITHLEIEGLNLPSLAEYMDLDSLTMEEVEIIKEWAKAKGDDHYFNFFSSIENDLGDMVAVRSNFFFVNLAPFESKTIKLKITATTGAHHPIEAWMTVPNEVIQPFTMNENRDSWSQFCCVMDHIQCYVTLMSNKGNLSALLSDGLALLSLENTQFACFFDKLSSYVANASCIVSFFSAYLSFLDGLSCHYYGEGILGSIKSSFKNSAWSMLGAFFSCLPSFKKIMELDACSLAANTEQILELGLDKLMLQVSTIFDIGIDGLAIGTNSDCSQIFQEKSVDCFPNNTMGGKTDGRTPNDPNDIYGYLSESGSHYMRQEIQNVQYEIEYENDTTLATAAAHTIIVRDTLDATKFDLNSLAARSVTIGDKRLELNGEQTFARTLDLRPDIYVIAQVNQDYDPTTGIIRWTIQSLDPMTMEPTNDPNQGVLPVNFYGDGVGFIDYSVNLRGTFADGTAISNRAGIIFDQNEVIMTPTWTNIVDAVKPTSHIEEVTLMGDSLSFSFVSSDNRSGVWYHSLYYRNASTEQEWLMKKAQIIGDSFMLPFDSLQTTEYFVIAVDSAGNVEAMKTEAEVIVESSARGFQHFVAGYGESTNAGWKFIASPIAGSIAATTVDNIFAATQYDLYYFDQGEETEWRNYKSVPFELVNGQGYLYATKEEQTLVFRGAYNNAETQEVSLVYTEDNPVVTMRGWNLIGNPFTMPAYVDRSYYTMNESGTAIEPNAASSTTAIPACNGVMVKAEAPGETVTFSRATQQNAPNQGCLQIAVKQASTRGNIAQDKAIVSFNAGDQLGKYVFNESNAKLYIPQGSKDYAIATATEKQGEIPLHFKVTRNGDYTISINSDGAEFDYLHLIDNLTGADVDLLVEPNYTFEAKMTDYASRFKLVFSVCGDADDDNAPFAFISNGNIIIVGAETGAVLQIVDMLGHVLVCKDVLHASAISTSGMVQGVYLLRLINGDEIRTQKIVID